MKKPGSSDETPRMMNKFTLCEKTFFCVSWRILRHSTGVISFFKKKHKVFLGVYGVAKNQKNHKIYTILRHRTSVKTLSSQKLFFFYRVKTNSFVADFTDLLRFPLTTAHSESWISCFPLTTVL